MEGQTANVLQEALLSLIRARSLEPCHLGLHVVSLPPPPLQQLLGHPPPTLGLGRPHADSGGPAWPPAHTVFASYGMLPHSRFGVQKNSHTSLHGEALEGMLVGARPQFSRPICKGPETQSRCCQVGLNSPGWVVQSESRGRFPRTLEWYSK